MNKSRNTFDFQNGYQVIRRLSRSFKTLEEARKFAEGKNVLDIYRYRGLIRVEWEKAVDNNG